MTQFPTSSPQLLVLPKSDSACCIDVANILPPLLQSVKHPESPIPLNDAERMVRNSAIDKEIIERENWGKKTESYVKMRSIAMNEVEGLYPSDHLDTKYSRDMYRDVRKLEQMVIHKLYTEMEGKPCFAPILSRFLEMQRELTATQEEELEQQRKELEGKFKEGRSRAITDETVWEAYREAMKARLRQRQAFFYSAAYTSPGRSYCDGCRVTEFSRFYRPSSAFRDHLSLRCFVGNTELRGFRGVNSLGWWGR